MATIIPPSARRLPGALWRVGDPKQWAEWYEHPDGRRVLTRHCLPGARTDDARRWIEERAPAAGPWVTAAEIFADPLG